MTARTTPQERKTEVRERVVVPAGHGRAVRVNAGERIRVETPHGSQAGDFFAFCVDNLNEWLSANHTYATSRNVHPRQGDSLRSNTRRVTLDFVEDGADGMHDMMIAACDQARYEEFGVEGWHRNCADNLREAMRELHLEIPLVPQPINLFTRTKVLEDGSFVSPPNTVPPGAYALFQARTDLICVISSCPFDLYLPEWTINAEGGVTELVVEVFE